MWELFVFFRPCRCELWMSHRTNLPSLGELSAERWIQKNRAPLLQLEENASWCCCNICHLEAGFTISREKQKQKHTMAGFTALYHIVSFDTRQCFFFCLSILWTHTDNRSIDRSIGKQTSNKSFALNEREIVVIAHSRVSRQEWFLRVRANRY